MKWIADHVARIGQNLTKWHIIKWKVFLFLILHFTMNSLSAMMSSFLYRDKIEHNTLFDQQLRSCPHKRKGDNPKSRQHTWVDQFWFERNYWICSINILTENAHPKEIECFLQQFFISLSFRQSMFPTSPSNNHYDFCLVCEAFSWQTCWVNSKVLRVLLFTTSLHMVTRAS